MRNMRNGAVSARGARGERTAGGVCKAAMASHRVASPRRGAPDEAGLTIDVREAGIGRRELDGAEQNRQVKTPRPDRAGVEHREIAVAADERNVRVPADDQRRAFGSGLARNVGPKHGPVDGDVSEENPHGRARRRHDVEHQYIGQCRGAVVDVSANREDRRQLGKSVEHGKITNIAGVENRIGLTRGEVLCGVAVGHRVRIGDNRQPQRAVIAQRYSGLLLYKPVSHHVDCKSAAAIPERNRGRSIYDVPWWGFAPSSALPTSLPFVACGEVVLRTTPARASATVVRGRRRVVRGDVRLGRRVMLRRRMLCRGRILRHRLLSLAGVRGVRRHMLLTRRAFPG